MDLKKMFPEIKSFPGRIELLCSGKLKASVTEVDGITVVLGDTDVKWIVVYNMPFGEIETSLKARDTDPAWWCMKVLASSSPILDDMTDEEEVGKVLNGILSKEKKQCFDNVRIRSYWSDTLADVTKLLIIREVSEPEKKASEIVDRCRHWDEQFVRSLDILEYVENSL